MAKILSYSTDPINSKDKIGYALGDMGMQFVFGLIASVLQKFYTDVLVLPITSIMLLFIIARVWDAVNDPLWGAIIDTRKVHKDGRYGRWMKYFSIPMGIATVLMFVKIPGLSQTGYFVYACVTYVAFGMLYTCVNVPYGSMASVITTKDSERSTLSIFRSVGAGVGTVPAMLLITLCYTNNVMDENKVLIGVIVIAILGVICTLLSYKFTKERVVYAPKENRQNGDTAKTIVKIIKSRPFIVLSITAMFFLAASVFSQSYNTYLAIQYFNMQEFSLIVTVCQYLPVGIIMLFAGKLIKKFGRKELCAIGCLIAGIFNLVLYFIQTSDPWIFSVFCFLAGFGNSFLFLQIWALATEVVDYNNVKYNIKDEATTYSVFSFIRKLGHAIAAIFINASLLEIGYSVSNVTTEGLKGMYDYSVLIPGVLSIVCFILLAFFYPLNKKKVAELQAEKQKEMENEALDADETEDNINVEDNANIEETADVNEEMVEISTTKASDEESTNSEGNVETSETKEENEEVADSQESVEEKKEENVEESEN